VIIDAHSHIVSDRMTSAQGGGESWRAQVVNAAGRARVWQEGRELTSVVGEFVDPDRIAEEAANDGVDHLLLSPWVRLLPFELPVGQARDVCRIQNAALAELVAARPETFSALGALPLQDPATAARDLPQLLRDGLAGVELSGLIAGRFLGDEQFEPFWAAAESCQALIFVHPTTRGLAMPVFDEYYLWNTVGNPLETAVTAAHLTVSGVLERHPGLRILLAHGGGALLALRGRLGRAFDQVPAARTRQRQPPAVSLGRFYYDTLTHDETMLRRLIEDVGVGQVLLGSDRPFDMGSSDPVGKVRALGLAPAAEAAILGGNAARLLGISPAGGPPAG
jgi:aminocarboxymuconate-semialdehyde decarboxylase